MLSRCKHKQSDRAVRDPQWLPSKLFPKHLQSLARGPCQSKCIFLFCCLALFRLWLQGLWVQVRRCLHVCNMQDGLYWVIWGIRWRKRWHSAAGAAGAAGHTLCWACLRVLPAGILAGHTHHAAGQVVWGRLPVVSLWRTARWWACCGMIEVGEWWCCWQKRRLHCMAGLTSSTAGAFAAQDHGGHHT